MAALIERLENAKEGSRELDSRIALTQGWYRLTPSEAKFRGIGNGKHGGWIHPSDCRDGKPVFCSLHGTDVHRDPPKFTQSIDTAMTLVPDKMGVSIEIHIGPLKILSSVVITEPVVTNCSDGRRITNWKIHEAKCVTDGVAKQNSSALALCIAALKARESGNG